MSDILLESALDSSLISNSHLFIRQMGMGRHTHCGVAEDVTLPIPVYTTASRMDIPLEISPFCQFTNKLFLVEGVRGGFGTLPLQLVATATQFAPFLARTYQRLVTPRSYVSRTLGCIPSTLASSMLRGIPKFLFGLFHIISPEK
jgi:hypothetical protein